METPAGFSEPIDQLFRLHPTGDIGRADHHEMAETQILVDARLGHRGFDPRAERRVMFALDRLLNSIKNL